MKQTPSITTIHVQKRYARKSVTGCDDETF